MRWAAPLVALALSTAHPAAAAGSSDALGEAGGRVAAAVAALGTSAALDERLAALAAAMAGYEAALDGLRGSVFEAEERERRLTLDLRFRRAEIGRLAAALQALDHGPAPAQALHPAGPLGAARAGAMVDRLRPALEAEAAALAAQLAEIEAARALRAGRTAQLAAGLAELAAAREALVAALARRPSAAGAAGAAGAVPAALLRDAETLSALAAALAAAGDGAGAVAGEPLALRLPVAGRALRAFREPDAAGVRRPGLLVEAAPLAPVTAPAAARVRYAGPFLDYGYVVVLEPRADVLVVLAGLATLETRSGAAVEAGAVLGLLGGRGLGAQEYLMLGRAGTGETPGETLYIEVRHGQSVVDPAPWFAGRDG